MRQRAGGGAGCRRRTRSISTWPEPARTALMAAQRCRRRHATVMQGAREVLGSGDWASSDKRRPTWSARRGGWR